MAYEKVPRPSTVYHLTKKEHLDSILDDGVIRRFDDTECWFCESLDKMRAYMAQTVLCEGKSYYAVGGQLCRYPKFVPEDYVLLKLTPRGYEDNWYRWNQDIPPGSSRELMQAAKEFSMLKIGYRGDVAFRSAEVIDVALFLTDGIVQGNPVQTTSELRELLFEHVEREQREYTDSLYRMTQGQLIANAGEIEANRFCYNALLTMRLDREQLKVLAAMDDPLEGGRNAWGSAPGGGRAERGACRTGPQRRQNASAAPNWTRKYSLSGPAIFIAEKALPRLRLPVMEARQISYRIPLFSAIKYSIIAKKYPHGAISDECAAPFG